MTNQQQNRMDISPERVALLLDRMDITDVLYRYGKAIDRCSVDQSDETFALLASCLTDDVVIDYGPGGIHKRSYRQTGGVVCSTSLGLNLDFNADPPTTHARRNLDHPRPPSACRIALSPAAAGHIAASPDRRKWRMPPTLRA
jgi:hypothetical protein